MTRCLPHWRRFRARKHLLTPKHRNISAGIVRFEPQSDKSVSRETFWYDWGRGGIHLQLLPAQSATAGCGYRVRTVAVPAAKTRAKAARTRSFFIVVCRRSAAVAGASHHGPI